MPNEGLSTRGMKGLSALSALCLLLLGGCAELAALDLDPFNVNGRQGAHPLGYDTLMRLGAAARAGGDQANAVALYRQAANVELLAAAPMVGAGNTLMEMGQVDEAILSYKSALQRIQNDPEALRERQTLALIYGLAGDRKAAEQMARRDLDPASVEHNLAFYDRLRKLSPEARRRAIQSLSAVNTAAAKS